MAHNKSTSRSYFGRVKPHVVYRNSFGSHRCGTVIHYGQRGRLKNCQEEALTDSLSRYTEDAAAAAQACRISSRGDHRETQANVYEFPSSLETNMIKKKDKKSAVWLEVYKIISNMVEENENIRKRLMACSQISDEGRGRNTDAQTGTPCFDADETIFGWV